MVKFFAYQALKSLPKRGPGVEAIFTPRRACAARGQVIALGLEYIYICIDSATKKV